MPGDDQLTLFAHRFPHREREIVVTLRESMDDGNDVSFCVWQLAPVVRALPIFVEVFTIQERESTVFARGLTVEMHELVVVARESKRDTCELTHDAREVVRAWRLYPGSRSEVGTLNA